MAGLGAASSARRRSSIRRLFLSFLPAYNELLQEALSSSRSFDYEGVTTHVLMAEYLAAICVQTGRIKDKLRVQSSLSSPGFMRERFNRLLEKLGLCERFAKW